MVKIVKSLWPLAGIALGLLIGTAIAQVVDHNNRVWTGTHTFQAPVTFESSATITTSGGTYLASDGSVAAPSYTFTGDEDTGIFHTTNEIFLATAGVKTLRVNTGQFTITSSQVRTPQGSISAPAIAAAIDANTGFFWTGTSGELAFASDGKDLGVWSVATGTLTATQVRNLNGTPVEVIAAPAAGKAIVIESVQWMLDWNANGYDSVGAGEDLVLEYTGGLDLQVCDNSTCLDAGAVADAFGATGIGGVGALGFTPVAAAAVDATILTAEWAAADLDANGDSPIHYLIRYRTVTLDIS